MPCCGLTPHEAPRTDRITQDPALVTCHGIRDELDEYLAGQMRDPVFAMWWYRASASRPRKLCIDGHAYRRRQLARRRRR